MAEVTWKDPAEVEALKEYAAKSGGMGLSAAGLAIAVAQRHAGYVYSGTQAANIAEQMGLVQDGSIKGVINAPAGYPRLPLDKMAQKTPEQVAAAQAACLQKSGVWNSTTNTCTEPSRYNGELARGSNACMAKRGSFQATGPKSGICYPYGASLPSNFTPYVPPVAPPKSEPGNGLVPVSSGSNTGMIVAAVAVVGLGAGVWWYMKRRKAAGGAVAGCDGCDGLAGAPKRRRRSRK